MRRILWQRMLVIIALLLPLAITGMASAAGTPDYTITYTITAAEDGSALWRVEYRTALLSETDITDFQAYTHDLPTVYLPQFRELMERSAAQAAVATGRNMQISAVTGDAVTQESPTGRYGVVVYSARWDGFARPGATVTIGDAFVGGLYLEKDNSLVIHYPEGYSVTQAVPSPDDSRDGLTWYGLRSFGAGEPRVVLEQPGFSLLSVAAGLVIVIVIVFAGFAFYLKRKKNSEEPSEDAPVLTDTELMSIEDRIIQLLKSHGEEMFQSDIVRMIGLPKSTVSTVLNDLHARNRIIKIKKGRENLIRLSPESHQDDGN